MGCGEFNLLEPSDKAEEKNRRVTFYLFNKDRLPNLPCAFDDIAPCKRQMLNEDRRHIPGFSCSFYDSWAQKCPAENRSFTVAVLIDRHIADREFTAHAATRLRLTNGSCSYDRTLRTSDALPFDEDYYILRFHLVPEGDSFSLFKELTDGHWMTLFENVPYDELDDHGPSHPPPEVEGQAGENDDGESIADAIARIHQIERDDDPLASNHGYEEDDEEEEDEEDAHA